MDISQALFSHVSRLCRFPPEPFYSYGKIVMANRCSLTRARDGGLHFKEHIWCS